MLPLVGSVVPWIRKRLNTPQIKRILDVLGLRGVAQRVYIAYLERRLDPVVSVTMADYTLQFHQQSLAESAQIGTSTDERPVLERIIERTRQDDVVFDVGANIGIHSCFLRRHLETIGSEGQVLSFEPHPANARRLEENAELNDLEISVHEIALYDESGEMHLEQNGDNPGIGTHQLDRDAPESGELVVPTEPGDALISRSEAPSPDVVKIDVEGAEMNVLKGLTEMFDSNDCRAAFVEVHRNKIQSFGFQPDDVEDFFADRGYEVTQLLNRDTEFFIEARVPEEA